jgi:hypothetical protein
MQQLRARLGKLEAEQAKRLASARANAENKECQRYIELRLKPEEQRTPEEQEELNKLSLTHNKPFERKRINIEEDPGYSAIMAFKRVVKEAEEERKRQGAEWRARRAALLSKPEQHRTPAEQRELSFFNVVFAPRIAKDTG